MIRERLGANADPAPAADRRGGQASRGVVDLLDGAGDLWDDDEPRRELREATRCPRSCAPRRRAAARRVIEAVADFDEALTARYLDGEPISADQLRKALREATLRLEVVPVLCGAAFKNKGVQPLLDAVVDYLPSPLDVPPVEGTQPEDGRGRPAQGRRQRAVLARSCSR